MPRLHTRVHVFVNSLSEFRADHYPSWQTGQVFNGLLMMAQESDELKDDPIVRGIEPVRQADETTDPNHANVDVGTMKAVMMQVLEALDAVPF